MAVKDRTKPTRARRSRKRDRTGQDARRPSQARPSPEGSAGSSSVQAAEAVFWTLPEPHGLAPRAGWNAMFAFPAPALDGSLARAESAPAVQAEPRPGAQATDRRPGGVLVVGLGDPQRGDGGIGLCLLSCLEQMDWPEGVEFVAADETVPRRAEGFAHVILLDAVEGPSEPGALYRLTGDEALACQDPSQPDLSLLSLVSRAVCRRAQIYGVQPKTTRWGAAPSADVMAAVPMLMALLRAAILRAAAQRHRMH